MTYDSETLFIGGSHAEAATSGVQFEDAILTNQTSNSWCQRQTNILCCTRCKMASSTLSVELSETVMPKPAGFFSGSADGQGAAFNVL